MKNRRIKKSAGGFSLVEILVMVAVIAILGVILWQPAEGQQNITSYYAAPQQPNGAIADTNDFPLTVTNGGLTIVTQTTNSPNGVYVMRQNVGLSIFDTFQVKNATGQSSNGVLELWLDVSGDGTTNTLTGVTNGVFCPGQQHFALLSEPWTCPAGQTNNFTYWTNIANTLASNVRDARVTAASNTVALPLTVLQHVWSQSWQ